MRSDQIKVIVIEPHKYPETKVTGDTVRAMHEIVGGFADGYQLEEDVFIVYDEDAKANAKEGNRRYVEEVFAGTIVIARWDDQQRRFKSLSDEQIKTYSSLFHELEEISKLEVMEALAMEESQ